MGFISYLCGAKLEIMAGEWLLHINDVLRGALLCLYAYWVYRFLLPNDNLRSHSASRRRYLVAALMMWQCIGCIYANLVWWPELFGNKQIRHVMIMLDTLNVPFVVLVLTDLTYRRLVTAKLALCHILPFVAFCVLGMFVQSDVLFYTELSYLVIYILIFTVAIIRSMISYNRFLRNHYSSLEGMRLTWLWRVCAECMLLLGCWLCCYTLSSSWWIAIFLVAFCVWEDFCHQAYQMIVHYEMSDIDLKVDERMLLEEHMHTICDISGVDESEAPSAEVQERTDEASPSAVTCKPEVAEKFLRQLREVCEEPKLFTDSSVTRLMLSEKMGISTTTFTNMLQVTTGRSFYQYINDLRISYAEELLRSTPIPIEQIPQMVGYKSGSKSVFYRAFTERHHCTPLEYRKQLVRS